MKHSRRSAVVFTTMVGCLGLTSALLMVLAPAPLKPDASSTLFAADSGNSLDVIFDTTVPPRSAAWRYIFVHQSATDKGDAVSLAGARGLGDHFVIGNGHGAIDGEIQIGQRWNHQQAPLPPEGARTIDAAAISIALVGDFEHGTPTPMQMRRLTQLVNTLQARFRIPAEQVTWIGPSAGGAALGRFFPADALRSQLLP